MWFDYCPQCESAVAIIKDASVVQNVNFFSPVGWQEVLWGQVVDLFILAASLQVVKISNRLFLDRLSMIHVYNRFNLLFFKVLKLLLVYLFT